MDVIEAILTRRSIRRGFSDSPIPIEIIEDIVRCGLHAPSSKDDQPWRITPIVHRPTLHQIATLMLADPRFARYVPLEPATGKAHEEYESSVVESAAVLRSVPLALAVENVGGFTEGRDRVASAGGSLTEVLVGYGFEYVGLGAAIQNMWLAAHAFGLSGVLIGDVLIAEAEIRDLLQLKGDLVGMLALGYSGEPAHAAKTLKAECVSE